MHHLEFFGAMAHFPEAAERAPYRKAQLLFSIKIKETQRERASRVF